MKPPVLLITVCALAIAGHAHEPVPLEQAQKAARSANTSLDAAGKLPVNIEADVERLVALRAGKAGVLVVPDKRLSTESFEQTGSPTPIGQLWATGLAMGGIPKEQFRQVKVSTSSKVHDVQLYLLACARNERGELELLVYGAADQPALRVPLTAANSSGAQSLPIEISAERTDDNSGMMKLQVLGKHLAQLLVTRVADE